MKQITQGAAIYLDVGANIFYFYIIIYNINFIPENLTISAEKRVKQRGAAINIYISIKLTGKYTALQGN